jgi:hypothetical protein
VKPTSGSGCNRVIRLAFGAGIPVPLREAVRASFEADGGIPEWLVRSDQLAVDVDEVA